MPYEIPSRFAGRFRQVTIFGPNDQFDHRGMVLRGVCELEYQCARLLYAFFRTRVPKLSWEATEDDLFSENGLLTSLSRRVKVATYLGLLSDDEARDLRILSTLRNMYAHGRERSQFNEDPKASAAIRSMGLFKNSQTLFAGYDEQGIFLLCCHALGERIDERRKQIEAAKSAA